MDYMLHLQIQRSAHLRRARAPAGVRSGSNREWLSSSLPQRKPLLRRPQQVADHL